MAEQCFFRGTTLNWPGNKVSQQLPRTPTTTHPVKAVLFAIAASRLGAKPVVYVCQSSHLKGIKKSKNVLAKVEDEVAFEVKPLDFAARCEGYLPLEKAIDLVKQLGIDIPLLPGPSHFDEALRQVEDMSAEVVERFYDLAKPILLKA